jgi:hypothetical protein
MNSKRLTLAVLVTTLVSSPLLAAQTASAPPQAQEEVVVLPQSELVLDQYRVQHVDPKQLYELAEKLVGRHYYVREHGGTSSNALGSLRRLADTIVLYDTKAQIERARELLARLDVARPETDRRSVEYRPRFVSLETVKDAVRELVDLSLVQERSLVVLHDSAARADAALAVLKRIDVPEKQVLLTCQLIEVGGGPQGPALPKELVDNLQKLLPQSQFAQVGMAMLKTSVGGRKSIALHIDAAGTSYQLAFTPVSFDEASAALTIENCTLIEQDEGEPRELFRTNTVLRGGEYTVLAATGATPRMLVVRVTPQG